MRLIHCELSGLNIPFGQRQCGLGVVPLTARSFEDRPMKAQFKMADRAGAAFVAVLGDKELAEGVVTLRRLADGVQKTVPAADVASWLTRLEGWA